MPLVALILAVVGWCVPCLMPVAVILGIIALVKSDAPAYAARKTMAIIALVLSLVSVPVWGMLAAIAIPNFIKFQARSKQAECKLELASLYAAQQLYQAEHHAFAQSVDDLDWRPGAKRNYAYRISADSVVDPTHSSLSVDELEETYPDELVNLIGVIGECPEECATTMACAGNIDNDDTIDVWMISSQEQNIDGQRVPAGQPFNLINDVTE